MSITPKSWTATSSRGLGRIGMLLATSMWLEIQAAGSSMALKKLTSLPSCEHCWTLDTRDLSARNSFLLAIPIRDCLTQCGCVTFSAGGLWTPQPESYYLINVCVLCVCVVVWWFPPIMLLGVCCRRPNSLATEILGFSAEFRSASEPIEQTIWSLGVQNQAYTFVPAFPKYLVPRLPAELEARNPILCHEKLGLNEIRRIASHRLGRFDEEPMKCFFSHPPFSDVLTQFVTEGTGTPDLILKNGSSCVQHFSGTLVFLHVGGAHVTNRSNYPRIARTRFAVRSSPKRFGNDRVAVLPVPALLCGCTAMLPPI